MLIWFLAAIGYVRAVAVPVERPVVNSATSASDLITRVLELAESEAKQVDGRQRVANSAAVLAVLGTVVTVSLAALLGSSGDSTSGSLSLNPQGAAAVQAACGSPKSVLRGRIEEATVNSPFITIKLDAGACLKKKSATLQLPRSSVSSILLEER
ncbi:hypothetical protein [Cryptosporangium sp. NPDC051539]|uniref:hypothetical protein n=1 Tax=Cryptosporangium sp. NPDC051539 TaxID=3363962 RepID=UPI00378D6AE6